LLLLRALRVRTSWRRHGHLGAPGQLAVVATVFLPLGKCPAAGLVILLPGRKGLSRISKNNQASPQGK